MTISYVIFQREQNPSFIIFLYRFELSFFYKLGFRKPRPKLILQKCV